MILESVEYGLLIWPTVEENRVTRTKKYTELSAAEKIQGDCDMKATYVILQGLYDSLKSRMELYMQNREHGRVILESVENGPLIWPTLEENGVTRQKYSKLSVAEKIQADCDMKATNIIFQGLPADIYSLVNHYIVAIDLWERVQLLMQGISVTKQ
nr:hypothetical protein [Tanacetum cinerariifolium]